MTLACADSRQDRLISIIATLHGEHLTPEGIDRD